MAVGIGHERYQTKEKRNDKRSNQKGNFFVKLPTMARECLPLDSLLKSTDICRLPGACFQYLGEQEEANSKHEEKLN